MRRTLWAAAGLSTLATGVTLWLLTRTNLADGPDVANVLALPVGMLGLGVSVWALRPRPRYDDPAFLHAAATRLLDAVTNAEARTLARLLGDDGDPRPADLAFLQPRFRPWRGDGGAESGSLAAIAAYYRSLNRGRLVAIGEPGSGKTVAALRLLLDLAAEAPGRFRVPVRLTLVTYDAEQITRATLDAWIATWLTRTYSVKAEAAARLVANGWILPVLDGLDEMPARRAKQVVRVLNEPMGPTGDPVVLTCRTADYSTALQDATVIELEPLTVDQIAAWLAHRFPGTVEPRWTPVIATMRKHPGGRLAKALASPLRLYLAVTVYADAASAPRELIGLKPDQLEHHLMAGLVAAMLAHTPLPRGVRGDEAAVTRWLRTVAAVDVIDVTALWSVLGLRRSAIGWGVGCALGLLAATPFIWLAEAGLQQGDKLGESRGVTFAVIGAGAFVVVAAVTRIVPPAAPGLWSLRYLLRRGPLAVGATIGAMVATIVILLQETALLSALPALALSAMVAVSSSSREVCIRPSDPLRWAKARAAAQIMASVVAIGSVAASYTSENPSNLVGEIFGVIFLAADLGLPIGFALALIRSPIARYRAVVAVGRWGNRLPLRAARFLDWAHEVGLLRMAGTAAEFRHERLRAHFRET
ncbi:NACHT domain-containing protein [Amycolatopsis sp. NPDC051758]|uniref:NACHT domain-containing protein n=1 Tax=Amycolatopsis sp. NPDC051758 TaxID=3363935 RepID=UPI00378ACF66